MKSDLAIATLIRSRMTELGLSRGEFAKRLGYKNIAKGIRRTDALCEGDIEGTKQVFDVPLKRANVAGEISKRRWSVIQLRSLSRIVTIDALRHDHNIGGDAGR